MALIKISFKDNNPIDVIDDNFMFFSQPLKLRFLTVNNKNTLSWQANMYTSKTRARVSKRDTQSSSPQTQQRDKKCMQ
jgi:hypothetical protein